MDPIIYVIIGLIVLGLLIIAMIYALFQMTAPPSLLCNSCKRFPGVLFHIDGKQLCAECMKKDAEARHG
jgi:hypothetical protein